MNHPLLDSLDDLSDSEVDQKIAELQKKYFMSSNPDIRMQIAAIIDIFKEEAKARRAKAYNKLNQNDQDGDLDSLINIS